MLTAKFNKNTTPTGVERRFGQDDLIVSKTDLKGRLTYVNRTFIEISSFTEDELIGAPHSVIRHPQMPRCVFWLLWQTIQEKQEIFAYVINMARNGDHYWVFAHVTPSFSDTGDVFGYHSNRRVPDKRVLNETIIPLYQSLLAEEGNHGDRKAGLEASTKMLTDILAEKGIGYDQFMFSL
ncbi:MAG: PAS domain-containing protein [Alphaproteobacteria bacterium]